MLRLVSDEDVHGAIIKGLKLRDPNLDIVRVQDVGLMHTPDPAILEWAATEERVVLTEDVNSMVGFAWNRVRAGQPMPGVIAIREDASIGQAIDDVLLVAQCNSPDQMRTEAVVYIPL